MGACLRLAPYPHLTASGGLKSFAFPFCPTKWAKVLHVTLDDVDAVWEAIAAGALVNSISRVIDKGKSGLNCRIDMQLTIGERRARIRTAWHYDDAESAPRLVSAYPKL